MSGRKGMKRYPQAVITRILQDKEAGLTHREIAGKLGLEMSQVKKLAERQRIKERKCISRITSKHRGRPRKTPLTTEHELRLRIKELEREIELYKSFLHAAGRM